METDDLQDAPAPEMRELDETDAPPARLSYREAKQRKYRKAMRLRQKSQTPVSLLEFFKTEVSAIRSTDSEARRKSTRDIATFIQYYDGNVNGLINDAGEWESDEINSQDLTYTIPLTAPHVDSGKTLLLKTQIEYEYEAYNADSVLDQEVARMTQKLAEDEMERMMTEDVQIREILYILTCGKTYRRHFWAVDPISPDVVPVSSYEDREVALPGRSVCAKCQTPNDENAVICQRCQSVDLIAAPGGTVTTQELIETEVELAENQLHIPHPLAVQHELSATNIAFSGFVVERDSIARAKAEYLYQRPLRSANQKAVEELAIIRNLERDTVRASNEDSTFNQAIGAISNNQAAEEVMREFVWLAPHRYSNIIVSEVGWYKDDIEGLVFCDNCEPPEGSEPVKAGTFLIDVYPHGIYLCQVDETCVEIHGEIISDKWVKMIFGMRPSHTDGAGLMRIKPLQDMENDRINLEFKVLMDDAAPATFLNRKYVSRLAQIGEYSMVDGLKDGDSWENVVYRLQGGGAHPALGNMGERNQATMQYVAGTFSSFGGGASDIRAAGTATGVAAMAEEVAGRFLEAIKLRKQADINSRYIVAKNIQRKSVDPQIARLTERFGRDVTERFLSCSLRHTVKIKAKKGTDQPQSQALKIASLQVLGNLQAAFKDSPQAQDMLSFASEEMSLPLSVGIGLNFKREAEYRVAKLREATKKFSDDSKLNADQVVEAAKKIFTDVLTDVERGASISQITPDASDESQQPAMADPNVPNVPSPPIDTPAQSVVMVQDHAVFMETYADFLMSESARGANVVFRACVFLMWQLHYDRNQLKQAETIKQGLRLQKLAAPPVPPAPTPEDIAGQQEEEEQKGIALEIAARHADEESKNEQLKRDEQAKDNDLERKIVLNEQEQLLANAERENSR